MHVFKGGYIIVNDRFSFLHFRIVIISQTLMMNIMNTRSEVSSELFKICHLTFLFNFASTNVVDHGLCDIARVNVIVIRILLKVKFLNCINKVKELCFLNAKSAEIKTVVKIAHYSN